MAEKPGAWLDDMARHVLTHGLNTASLRPLAAAAGTSDRMLIYHFGNKDGVIAALLTHLAEMFTDALAQGGTDRARSPKALVAQVVALQRRPEMAGFLRVWFDILSAAGQGNDAHRATGGQIIDRFRAWIAARLPEDDPDPQTTADACLTLIEGMALMDMLGHTALADRALARLLGDAP